MGYPWYEKPDQIEKITQGDIIFSCPVLLPKTYDETKGELHSDLRIMDVIVMSQACDLSQGKIKDVLLCGLIDLKNEDKDKISSIKKGYQPSYHLISKSEITDVSMGYRIVDFKNVYSLPVDILQNFAHKSLYRLRLLPPYREHLSQAFARVFMRVGLPNDLSEADVKADIILRNKK